MKLKNIYSLMAGALVFFAACSPDDYDFGGKQYTSDQLNCPNAYTVTINGNKVDLASKISGCTPLWITPSGRSQEQNLTLELPFAGDYEVTFGADTRDGAVYGSPYKFNIPQNDFSLLSDAKWFYLADSDYKTGDALPDAETLAKGISKVWYPNDKDYGLGCTGPVMYMTPYDPTNSGNYTDEEAANLVYKQVPFGRANWAPNWDPGFQSWLIPEHDAYMASYMKFSMDAANGCVAEMYRGEYGTDTQVTQHSDLLGKFALELTDKNHPTMSFTDCYSMHNIGFDDVCSNYTQNIIVADLTPYYLCLITKRTNSEGNWYIVWNFVSEEVKKTNGACIPKSEASYLTTSAPELPTYSDLAKDIFTVENNGVTYVGNQVTYTVDTEAPYDFYWWNGAENVNKWEALLNGEYNNSWAPMADDGYSDNELILNQKSDGTYEYTYGDYTGDLTIGENTVTFSKGIQFLTATSDMRKVKVAGTTFAVLSETAGDGITIGVPNSKDADGNVNSYTCVNLKVKAIGGGTTGPTVVPLDAESIPDHIWIENNCFRLAFWSYGSSGSGIFKDAGSVKLKKNQVIRVKFTLKDASAWTAAPKCALIDNNIKTTWEPGCFDDSEAVTVNLAGETVVTLTNTTGSTQKFTDTCLDLSIQMDGFYKDWDGNAPDMIQSISCEIE